MLSKQAKEKFFEFETYIKKSNAFDHVETWGSSQGFFIRFNSHHKEKHMFDLRMRPGNHKIVVNYKGPGKGVNRVVYQSAFRKAKPFDMVNAIHRFIGGK